MQKLPLKLRLKKIYEQYGKVAVYTYFGIFAVVLGGFTLAAHLGVQLEGTSGAVGTFGIAYAATKLTQPLRILATLVLTPVLARGVGPREQRSATSAAPPSPPGLSPESPSDSPRR